MNNKSDLDIWIEKQTRICLDEMRASISATHLTHQRAEFNQSIRPLPGSILASPECARYDPDPDYFFHWQRDAAIIIDALRLSWEQNLIDQSAFSILHDYIAFERRINTLDGRIPRADDISWEKIAPSARQHLRDQSERANVFDLAVGDEARVNPNGTLDIFKWARPQYDGPALRALTLLHWRNCAPNAFDLQQKDACDALIKSDVIYTLSRCDAPCFDLWEEEPAEHYFTKSVQASALSTSARWLDAQSESELANAARQQAQRLTQQLDLYWNEEKKIYCARRHIIPTAQKDPDISIILAALRADDAQPTHSVRDPRVGATLEQIEIYFRSALPINANPARQRAPALGRFPNDVYFNGGAWYVATLAAAEFYYRRAKCADNQNAAQVDFLRGDSFLETIRALTPKNGQLSEQVDRVTGVQISAKRLAWSAAAFLSCARARSRFFDF